VITGDVESPELLAAVKELQTVAVESGAALEPVSVTVDEAKDLVLVDLPLPGAGDRAAEQDAVEVLREDVVPQTVGAVDGVEVAVTGSAASSMDFTAAMSERGPWVVAFVLVLAFGLLLASFRSVVVAVKAIVLNLLSVAAAYGVMVATFQWGWGESLLNFESTGAIAAWLPLFLFVILFGLSMDYHVLHPQPGSRTPGRRCKHSRGHPPRHHVHRRGREQRRDHHGRRLLDLRDPVTGVHEAAGRGPGRRRPAGRDARPWGPAALDHAVARRGELVPAPLAGVAAADRPRRRGRAAS
jgi:RND superfamily putative drug exporter